LNFIINNVMFYNYIKHDLLIKNIEPNTAYKTMVYLRKDTFTNFKYFIGSFKIQNNT